MASEIRAVYMDFNVSSKLLEKMWDTVVDKGVSAFLRPWQMKRENKARLECIRNEKLEMIKIDNEAKQLQISLDKEQFAEAEIVPQIQQIVSEVTNTKLHEIVKEEISVAKAVEYAGEYIEEKQMRDEKPTEKPTEDWLSKWKKRTQEFTDDDALKLWGRVLAGEFASPGCFSYKFLDWMGGITPSDAQLISKLMENVFMDRYFRGDEIDENMPLTYNELLLLQELEVLQGVESLGMETTMVSNIKESFKRLMLSANNKKVVFIEHPDASKKAVLNNVCILTRIGREVKKLCEVDVNPVMIKKIADHFIKEGYEVSCADVLSIESGRIHFLNKVKME